MTLTRRCDSNVVLPYVTKIANAHHRPTGWAKLNGPNAVCFVVVKYVLENFDNFWQMK